MTPDLDFRMFPQPDDTTCGPACLCAVYNYFNDSQSLSTVIAETGEMEGGGTLAVMLACHALKRGYQADIYTYNLSTFDPSWFDHGQSVNLAAKLRRQAALKNDPKLRAATPHYLRYLELGGKLHYADLTVGLLRRFLKKNLPILTGLSATYLYGCRRELQDRMKYDDVRGLPTGHFVVLCGYDADTRCALVADPLYDNPTQQGPVYHVPIDRLVGAILLGVLTYDANLLVIQPGTAVSMPRPMAPRGGS